MQPSSHERHQMQVQQQNSIIIMHASNISIDIEDSILEHVKAPCIQGRQEHVGERKWKEPFALSGLLKKINRNSLDHRIQVIDTNTRMCIIN